MKKEYGVEDFNDMLSLCTSQAVFRLQSTAAEEVSKWFGDTLSEDTSHGTNKQGESENTGFGRDKVIEHGELEKLPDMEHGTVGAYWKYKNVPPFKYIETAKYFKKHLWDVQDSSTEELFIEIPASEKHVTLQPFSVADYERLGIPEALWEDGELEPGAAASDTPAIPLAERLQQQREWDQYERKKVA